MKNLKLVLVLMFLLAFAACSSDEDDACVTAFDCPSGYSCIDSICRPPVSDTDTDHSENGDVPDSSDTSDLPLPGDGETLDDSTEELPDDALPGANGDDDEIPDNITACPNACSGFGECNFETGVCTCDETHQGEDCSECKDGYHLEAEGDDEDGNPDLRSCVIDLTCNPNPCNNNGCREEGSTVKCTCAAASHLSGRWCDECAEGYAKSNVDGKCKEDCTIKTCTAPQKCGMDYTTNEAGCNACENEYYTGADCRSCDIAHFCNGHATACVVSGGTEKCTCDPAYKGEKCNTCNDGYFMSNGVCIKSCDVNKCFQSHQCSGTSALGIEMTSTVSGHGTCSNTTGECLCDSGWKTGTSSLGIGTTVQCGALITVFETLNNVECTICDKNNPPSQYASSGCPQNQTEDTSLCSSVLSTFCGPYGSCYYKPDGEHKLYCVCSSGYHLDNGNELTGYCTADE